MEIINTLLSNNIDYIQALRFAEVLPKYTAPEIPKTIAKKSTAPVWIYAIGLGAFCVVAITVYTNYQENKKQQNG